MRNSFKTIKGTELPIMNLRGKEYLEVKWRIVWFREEKTNWRIETELLRFDDNSTVAKAWIKDENGNVIATGHKAENKQGFADHHEKAESGAIGRALALIGYGTQFTDDLDEGERVVDSPVATKNQQKDYATPSENDPGEIDPPRSSPGVRRTTISEAQGKRAFAIAKSKGWESEIISQELHRIARQGYGIESGFFYLSRFSYEEVTKAIEAGQTADEIIKAKRGN